MVMYSKEMTWGQRPNEKEKSHERGSMANALKLLCSGPLPSSIG